MEANGGPEENQPDPNPGELPAELPAELPVELSAELSAILESTYALGILARDELDSRAVDAIKELSSEELTAVFEELKTSDLEHVSNKSAFLCGLIKSQRQKARKLAKLGQLPTKKAGPDDAKLKEILERTGYNLDVSTGQRKYGGPPPNWEGAAPGAGHEIYCGKIPKDLFEDSLIPMFEKYGNIWDLRLMMDPITGRNRGYCFVTYAEQKNALDAVRELNNLEIRPGRRLRVNVTVANARLFVGNIPKNKAREELLSEFQKHSEGLLDVIVYPSPDDPKKKNRGFAFLDYSNHKVASAALRRMARSRLQVWGLEVIVNWAQPQEEPNEEAMSRVKVLYVRNLKSDTTEAELREKFEAYGNVEHIKKSKGYAFVNFTERDAALKAMQELNGTKIGDLEVEVSLAKPLGKGKQKNRQKTGFYNFPAPCYNAPWSGYPYQGQPRMGNKMRGNGFYVNPNEVFYPAYNPLQMGYNDYYCAGGRYGANYNYYANQRYGNCPLYPGQKPWYPMGASKGQWGKKGNRGNKNVQNSQN